MLVQGGGSVIEDGLRACQQSIRIRLEVDAFQPDLGLDFAALDVDLHTGGRIRALIEAVHDAVTVVVQFATLRVNGCAHRQVGQRDTLAFALVRVWSVLARLLAPVFAFFGEKQAQAVYQQAAGKPRSNKEIQEGENHDR